MRFSSLLTVAGMQLYDLKIALAHQGLLKNIQLLLHLPAVNQYENNSITHITHMQRKFI